MSNLFADLLGVPENDFGVFLGVTDRVFNGDITFKVGLPGDFVKDLYFFRRCSEQNIGRTFFFVIPVIT